MSLIKQIRIAITVIIMLVAGGCLSLSVVEDHHYMMEQLQKKNTDNANALAITLSNIPKDDVTVELIVSAQFDMGNYHRIAVIAPDNRTKIARVDRLQRAQAPAWFVRWAPIRVAPGVAAIQSGWKQYGTLVVESDPSAAYDQLWQTTRQALLWTLLVALASYKLAGWWLKRILKPLDDVIAQAEALGQREYITIEVPKTPEFHKLVLTMNALSARVREIVTEESQRLSAFNQQINFDEVTGLMNQAHFSGAVAEAMKSERFVQGGLWWVQLRNLAEIDRQLGYTATNQRLRAVAQTLQAFMLEHPNILGGRLAGSLFALFTPHAVDDYALATQLKSMLDKLAVDHEMPLQFVLTHTKTSVGDDYAGMQKVMTFILDLAAQQAATPVRMMNANSIVASRKDYLQQWKQQFVAAIEGKQIKLERYPVVTKDHSLLHDECVMRMHMQESDQWLSAGAFIEWATQLGMMQTLDTLVLTQVHTMMASADRPMSLNVSAAALQNADYLAQLQQLIEQLKTPAMLSFEVSEEAAFADFSQFKSFVHAVKLLGCSIGLEHVCMRLAQLGDLHELGLDFIKFDATLIRGIASRQQQQSLLRGLSMMVRTMGIMPIAEGVETAEELAVLQSLGVEAFTGPYIREYT